MSKLLSHLGAGRVFLTVGTMLWVLGGWGTPSGVLGQEYAVPSGGPAAGPQVQPGQAVPGAARPSPGGQGKPPQAGGPAGDKPKGAEADKAGDQAKESAKPETVRREAKPPEPPDPSELLVQPDASGLVQFQFRNQPWPDLLRWLAAVSNLSLDWQELPSDYLNIATQRPYSLAEARDLINRHLLARGFTMLEHEGVLSVVKIADINPAMVPRVTPAQLADQQPHRFVRVSFVLSWLLADEVVEEFKSMASPNGKLTALAATNRLEAMDVAINLRDMHDVLEQEQSLLALENLAREFPLQHARASAVKEQLQAFLGIESNSRGGGSMPQDAMQMVQRQMQQMQQQMQQAQANNKGKAAAGTSEEKVYLVANDRSNSIIVHAPPDKMAIIASFLARVDVPNENSMDFQRLGTRMKVFRLASLGPAELVASLSAMDVLEPTTRLQVDETNKAIIAYASVADQYLIQSVIDRLDGSARSLHVISLRRLGAESVAGSIKFLMGAEDEEPKTDNRRSYYSFYDPFGSRNNSNKKEDKLRVGANVQDNQILLWANEIELQEVQNLLVKLGEIPPDGGRQSTMRVMDASRQPETYEYLKRLKEQWDRISPNPLILPDAKEFQPPADPDDPSTVEPQPERGEKPPQPATSETITRSDARRFTPAPRLTGLLAQTTAAPSGPVAAAVDSGPAAGRSGTARDTADGSAASAGASSAGVENASRSADDTVQPQAAPITIAIDESGNLILQSNDPSALDRLEEIMRSNRPPRRPYDVFKVKYARASWVSLNLEEYFDNKKEEQRPNFFSYFYGLNEQKEEKKPQLGERPPLRFIWDNDTNSIVVQGADDIDRQTIKELIELWDVPEPVDGEGVRYTRLIRIRFSRAESIVSTIKDAYRDLLSSNDKAFQQNQGNGRGGGDESENKRAGNSQGVKEDSGMNYSFRGKLSLGADSLTNSILVSAEGKDLLELVDKLIQELDQAAQREGNFEVYKLTPSVNGDAVIDTLRAMLQSPSQQQPEQRGQRPAQNEGRKSQNGNVPANAFGGEQ
ncbi:MAG: hypothetical protein KDA45_03230 [Planctomycetales bacterium]|nr:hypothetical protein [Planctomycetales bacterium]